MKKIPMILLALLAAACIAAMPFLCAYSNILPEVSTAYYEQKAQDEAQNATGAEAELMRLLLGGAAAPAAEAEPTKPEFTWFGFVIALGAAAALAVAFILIRQQPDLRPALMAAGTLAVPFGLIGARLTYCLVNLPFYLTDITAPEAMLKVWEGGLSLAGALAFIALAGVVGAKIGKASIGRVLDAMVAPMLLLAISCAAAAREISMWYGPEIGGSFPAVTIHGVTRLDTALLTILLLLILAAVILRSGSRPAGQRFALTAFLYGAIMILLESLRKDGHMVWGFVHAEMVLDLCFALPALLYLAKTKKRILLSLLATAVLAGAVVALEFALDRSSIGDALLYGVYICVISAYLWLGCSCAKRSSAV